MSNFHLEGLNGSNLLGYMAALGTLATATRRWSDCPVRLNWLMKGGIWQPSMTVGIKAERSEFLAGLAEELGRSAELSALSLADDLTLPVSTFRQALLDERRHMVQGKRLNADFLAAFGSEVVESRANGKPTGRMADTDFRTMSGAGHQHFLGTMRTFVKDTTAEHLEKSLFQVWRYDDPLEKHSMRWDPMDDVRYALRWDNPSGDKSRKVAGSMWGANRLAIEALPLFPAQPAGSRLATTGFARLRRGPVRITWPIWSAYLSADEVRSVLALKGLQDETPDRAELSARGIVEVFRSQRITQGKYRNFTQSVPV